MNYDNLLFITKQRRSMRRYNTDQVPIDNIKKIIEAARWAPSGNNSQPWEFVVVRDEKNCASALKY
jgi:nitroreductase